MMSVAPVASAGEAAGYYSNSDNYYFLGSLQSLWMGEGAKALGLEGNIRGDDLTAVLEGRLPDGSRLGKEVNGQHVHRPGHDLTFSAPKSVSILALIGNDKEMVEAHNHAVRVAAGYVEKLISARDTKDGVTSIVHTGKMVAAAYTHDTSRNLDPQLHTHLLIANMTEYAGKWKALATDYIHNAGFIETVMKHQVTLGKIYRSALRERVEALGHEVEEVGKHGMWEIKGVPEDVRDEYSSRGREIQGAVGAEATLRSRDVAAKDTRRAKVDPSRMRLMERWLGQMKEKGFDLKAYQESVVPRDAGLRETAPQPERDHQAKPVPAGPELASLQTSSTAEKSVDTPAQPAERESQSRQAVTQPADTLRQTVQTGPEKTPATRSVPAAQLDTEIPRPELTEAVRLAISQLSDSKTRFTFGELMMTTAELSEQLPEIQEIRVAIDAAIKDGMIVPLDSEKGVFTSRIHLLDELSIQALSQEHLKSTKVVSFTRPAQYAPAALEVVEKDALVLMNAPSGVAGIRDLTAQLAGIAGANGRDVQVLASSAERAISLAKSDDLRERIISRQHVLSGDFYLKPQSTLIIEGAERLGLKETLVLLGEARAQDAQLVFLDSAGRQANGNAMSVLESAGVARSRRTEPAPGLEAEVVSIPNKRDRYEALANRFAELSGGTDNVTAVVVGKREQAQLTGLVREALQNAGQLGRDGVEIEARQPVWLDSKTRRMPGSYHPGMVLEDRTDAKERKSYVIDRVHEDTRVLSLIDGDGVLTRMKIGDISADWRLFSRETLSVATGEKLLSVAGDREHSLKAKDRLEVTGISEKGIEVKRGKDTLTLPKDQPLYLSHAYVTAPGGRDNDTGVVLAALNSRDISTQTMNSLAQSGHRAEVFTAEVQDRAEARLQRMKTNVSPVQLVRNLSGHQDVSQAVDSLHDSVRTDAGLAVWRAINDQRTVVISELKLATEAQKYHPDLEAIGNEIGAMIKNGELLSVSAGGEPVLVSRSTWEMEKAILSVVEEGKGTQQPLLEQVPEAVLNGLTDGQKKSTTLVLGTPEARSRTLIIAQLNADRKAINAGIHAALAARGELGEKAIKVPVLDKITHTRHEFNKTEAWEAGMVVKRGDRYQDVVAVDRNGRTVTVRDEEGKIALVSPKELITGDVQLFRRSEMEVRSGDLLKFTATDREQGQMANQRYTVESVSEEGNIRLKGENGRVTINPEKVRAQQHIDYGWAVTGYGAQGASSDYVIALEGTKDGRKALASRRAFYISTSRVKEHVQIYTDKKADWVKAIKTPERDIKTAHDALAPETQRKQAKAIWAMGQPVNKTAIGRAWVRHQGMQEASLTAKIIPATRRFPEPALALPVYDNNGRSAGLALVSLVSSPEGRMTQGETRMVMTERARGAVLQRSQSGNTIVASDLTAALDAVRNHPKDGVVWQTGDEPPSAWLLKVSGGTKQDVSPGIVSTLTDEQNVQQLREQMLADQVRNEEAGRSRQPESLLAEVPQEEVIRLKPEDINPRKPEPLNPDADVIARVRGQENTDGQEMKAAAGVRSELEGADKASGELSRASRVIADLANAERDMLRAAENTERGRMPEREEQTLTRTIQKER
ncbi:MobF family relaxase [Enterobacter roggenkampii]|uniref:MobF family relaxase n=1 Tax=Enterobacter roggenkampii TaxID=1812935 RepID=UPI002075BD2B|nr:MobF family relaxase [Enterobacter roggenkampii]MCM7828785.1 conjugative relaxase [Enterobacter roggenkampii]